MLEMQHMATLCLQICEDWSWHTYPCLADIILCVRHCLLHYWSLSLLLCYYIQEFTDINNLQLSTVWLVTKLLVWNTKFWFSVQCPFLSASSTIFFVADVSCTTAWNMLWCQNSEVHVHMRHSFVSSNGFKHYVSFWSCSSEFETTLDDCWLLHDSYRWSEWSGTMFSLIPGVHNMN